MAQTRTNRAKAQAMANEKLETLKTQDAPKLLVLNIYDPASHEVAKTYALKTEDIMFATIEDIIKYIFEDQDLLNDFDAFVSDKQVEEGDEIFDVIIEFIPKCLNIIKPILCSLFYGLTEEEIRYTKPVELIAVCINFIKYVMSYAGLLFKGNDSKN